jgi:guanine nucleotide-binding protein alpha-1 subunit
MHTRAAFHAERIAWRTVIYLNLVGSVRRYVCRFFTYHRRGNIAERAPHLFRILEAISPEMDVDDPGEDDDFLNFDTASAASVIISSDGRPPSAICGTKIPKYETYRERLRPLTELEERLTRLLSSPDEDEPTRLGPTPDGWTAYGASMEDQYDYTAGNSPVSTNGRPTPTLIIPQLPWGRSGSSPASPQTSSTGSSLSLPYSSPNGTNFSSKSKGEEVAVRTNTNWKRALSLGGRAKSPKSAQSGEIAGWWEDPDDPVHALHALAQAMLSLWQDPSVRRRLTEKQVRIEECSGL